MAPTAARQAKHAQFQQAAGGALVDIRPNPVPALWTASIRTSGGDLVPLHSTDDPMGEARAQVAAVTADDPAVVVIIGAGLGFVTEAARQRFPRARLVVIEPIAALAQSARARTPALYDTDRVHLLAGPDYPGAGDLWRLFDQPDAPAASTPVPILHPVLMRAVPSAIATAVVLVRRAIHAADMNAQARRENAGRYVLNTLCNLAHVIDGADPARLAGRFSGVPAIVVGAGPSLDDAWPALREIAGRGLIIATDTSWRPLVAAGIDPHFVIALDPTVANGRHLSGVHPHRDTWLLAEGSVDPDAISALPASVSVGTFRVGSHHPWPWIGSLGLDRPLVRVWGSVLTAAFDLPLAFGCDPIVFVGADLSFTDKRPYCRGTSFEEDWARHASRGVSLRQIWQNTLASRALLSEPDLHGECVLTAPHLVEFRNWLVARAGEATNRRIINATGAGILVGGGIEQAALRDVLAGHPERDAGIRAIIRAALSPATSSSVRQRSVKALQNIEQLTRIDDGAEKSGAVRDWLSFGRPSLSVESIHRAIAASRHALETAANAVSPVPLEPVRPALRLHEADRVARMRALLTGNADGLAGCSTSSGSSTAAAGQGERPDAEIDAVRVLGALLALSHLTTDWGEDVKNGAVRETVPVSCRFAWTADARPWVCLLEELLVEGAIDPWVTLPDPFEVDRSDFWLGPIEAVETGDETSLVTPRADDDREDGHEDAARQMLVAHRLAIMAAAAATGTTPYQRLMEAVIRGVADPALQTTSPTGYRINVLESGSAAPLPIRIDAVMRALTGTIARTGGSTGSLATETSRVWPSLQAVVTESDAPFEPRLAFLSADVAFVEPELLTSQGLARGWSLAAAGAAHALFVPSGSLTSVRIAGDGTCEAASTWPVAITGELPWGAEGGALAWHGPNAIVMIRPRAGASVVTEPVPFLPTRVVVGRNGMPCWSGFAGGLWEWMPGAGGRLLVDAPKSAGLRLDGGDLVLAPIMRDDQGRVARRRLTYEWRCAISAASLRRVPAGPEGQCSATAVGRAWTARTFPFSDLIRLERPEQPGRPGGAPYVLACHTPVGAAWAGDSLLVTTGDGAVILFRDLASRLASLDGTAGEGGR